MDKRVLDDNTNASKIKNITARRRWKILARAIIKEKFNINLSSQLAKAENVSYDIFEKSLSEDSHGLDSDAEINLASVRSFDSFDLIEHDHVDPSNSYLNYKITNNSADREFDYNVNIHQIKNREWTARDLIGFNNTGNVEVWTSEYSLTYYVLDNLTLFKDAWILELGGGMTCLAGLILAKYAEPFLVQLTDGNSLSVENVKKSLQLNDFNCFIKCSILKWEQANRRNSAEYRKYDFILCADCIFFDETRNALIETIQFYLSTTGVTIVCAPKRGETMNKFIQESTSQGFKCETLSIYNKFIWEKHIDLLKNKQDYCEDIHYPILIIMTKVSNNNK